jgi:hypothetical protein
VGRIRLLTALIFSAALLLAADFSGQWAGKTKLSIDGQVQEDTMHLSLKQSGDRLTGSAGPTPEQQAPIRNGKVEGSRVTFETPVPNGVFQFDLTLEDGHLKGNVVAIAQGQSFKATIDATRTK